MGPDGWAGWEIHGVLGGKRTKGDPEFKSAVPPPIPDDLASAYSPRPTPHFSPESSEVSQGQGNRAQYTAGTDLHRINTPDLF